MTIFVSKRSYGLVSFHKAEFFTCYHARRSRGHSHMDYRRNLVRFPDAQVYDLAASLEKPSSQPLEIADKCSVHRTLYLEVWSRTRLSD